MMSDHPEAYATKKIIAAAWAVLLSVMTAAAPSQGQVPSSGSQPKEDAARAKAEQVLKQARDATRAGLKGAEVKSLIVKSTIETSLSVPQAPNRKIRGTTDEELSVSLPDKVRKKSDANYTTNREISEWVINGGRVSQRLALTRSRSSSKSTASKRVLTSAPACWSRRSTRGKGL